MPTQTGTAQSVEGLVDDQSVAFKLPKTRSTNDVDFLLCLCLEIRIANVGCMHLQVVEFCKEDTDTKVL